MALDIQIPYRGDQYLFQGISGGANALAQGAEQMTKRFRQIQDAGKAADYFMKAGGDEMYAQAGIHPDEWKTLGARDKAAAVQAIMEKGTMAKMQAQAQDLQAQAQERRQMGAARAQQMQLSQDEAEAFPKLMQTIMEGRSAAPAAAGGPEGLSPEERDQVTAQPGEGAPANGAPMRGNFTPEEIMTGMATMGKTSPRLASALSRTLIPRMMEGTTQGPQSYRSPEGRPYVWMGHTLMADRPQFDPSELMGNVPAGYQVMPDGKGGVKILPEKKPIDTPTQLPAAFYSKLDKLAQEQKDAARRAAYSDAEAKRFLTGSQTTPEQYRQRMKAAAAAAQEEIAQHLSTYETEGYGKPETWQTLKKKYGLTMQSNGNGGAAPMGATPGTKAPGAVNTKALIEEANRAIAAGADPKAVRKRLTEKYGIQLKE